MSVKYYDKNADAFAADTVSVDLTHLYAPFLDHILQGGLILDAGCGTGRDSLAFLKAGYRIEAFDASSEMVRIARKNTGLNVLQMSFQEMSFERRFDGIWACASLLHVHKTEELGVFEKLSHALKQGGVLYASFKLGIDERIDANGRYFNNHNQGSISKLCAQVPLLKIANIWETSDSRPGRESEQWLNVICIRD
jgi:SAM-dependent methyltransferase